MHHVAAKRKPDGTTELQIDWQKLESTRKTQPPVRPIKGGKHDRPHRFFEDQKFPHNRASKNVQVCCVLELAIKTL